MKGTITRHALALALTLTTASALADEGAAEYRHHVYEALGGHMQSMADILRQKVAHTDHLAPHARAIADLSEIAPTLFPAGSEGGDALPAIWENPDDFNAKMTAFGEAAQALKAATASGEGVGPAFQNLAKACKACHEEYRAE
ncbi:MAG: cytochrome c [Pseudomonadales bacterium]